MLKGFKDFILRGNVVELAIAVVVGGAFQKVVDSFVTAIITPLLNAMPGAKVEGWGFQLVAGKPNTLINFSTIINSVIVFVMTAAVVYFVFVVPMNKLSERRKAGVEPEPKAPSEEVLLLQEIRDALRARN
ncbi:Large-conductance mechanosensitive channel [Austwickia sp. TVS 96-490-7B]|uniref:large conductance mechanosensitive channel protein MscL n=1 Tax=Austwickia sp. TVS 96-490-7B TaxID=2830843 RepID=UPI001C591947|nr:large conductance mechanosensitive channel protein MscL [Austwickia sp. TVS 96-490-7B]MBW3085581.1 Large-conductance mechanosensitive channel [Austwickia sp. TVS 96-490-7B]